MTRPDVPAQVERVLKPIQQFVRGWMLHTPSSHALADEFGIAEQDLWILGRAAVMGDCTPAAIAAGLGVISPARVQQAYDAMPDGLTLPEIATRYANLCTDWGTAELARFDAGRMERLDELGRRLCDAASAAFGAVFAAWRDVAPPGDAGGRVSLTIHTLRELRGGAHLAALLACGITPLDAILASPAPAPRSGPVWAESLGWTGPFRNADEVREQRTEAERLTSRMLYPVYESLDESELDEFAILIETTRDAIEM